MLATQWDVNKHYYVDNGWFIPEPPHSLIPTGPIMPPSDINYSEYIYLDAGGTPQFAVIISWTASRDPRVTRYQLELSGPNGDYRLYDTVAGISQEVPNMRQGQWTIVLKAFDSLGRSSVPISLSFVPIGLSARPLCPTAFYATPQGGNMVTLFWVPTGEIDVMFYWIKFTGIVGGAVWDRATTSIARVDRNTTQVNTPIRYGTYLLKAIDSLGQESVDWIEVEVVPQQTERTIILDLHEEPTWAGDPGTNWHHNVGEMWMPPPHAPEPVPPGVFPGDRGLVLNQTPTRVGVYDFANTLDLGDGGYTLATMSAYVEGYGSYIGNIFMADWVPIASQDPLAQQSTTIINRMATWIPLAIAVPLAIGSSPYWDAHIEARVSVDGTTWQDWFPLKSTVITAQKFEWRMIGALYDLQTTLRAHEARVVVELPLRNVQGSDVPLDSTGHLIVTYASPFVATPTVQLTARQSLAPGGTIVIIESDRTHFELEHRDASGAAVAGSSVDYFVQGYGGHA